MNTPTVGQLVVAAFAAARTQFSDIQDKWIRASYRTGSKIPQSLASASIQKIGDVDLICRALEDELVAQPESPGAMDFRFSYLVMMSEMWVSMAYAICFALKERGLLADDNQFRQLAEDLRLVRVQLEKHQIASDKKLTAPLTMTTGPSSADGAPERFSQYDKNDRKRAHIPRTGSSGRRSFMWEVIEVKAEAARWIERRNLSDAMLEIFNRTQ
jgi:hypothetical protein